MKDLTVFILTHNRPNLVQTAIESVLSQEPFDFKFVVSDNSDNDETESILKGKPYFGKLNYYHTTVNGADRWRDIFSRVETEFFMVFHDDDEMLPHMVEILYSKINAGEYLAVGGNAEIHKNGKYDSLFLKSKHDIEIKTIKQLALYWLNSNIVPFPSYMYSKECINCFPWTFPAGKNSDSAFITNILERGKSVLWVSNPLMIYNIHGNQDSSVWDYYSQYGMFRVFYNKSKDKVIRKTREKVLYGFLSNRYITKKEVMHNGERLLLRCNFNLFLRLQLKKILKK